MSPRRTAAGTTTSTFWSADTETKQCEKSVSESESERPLFLIKFEFSNGNICASGDDGESSANEAGIAVLVNPIMHYAINYLAIG